MILGEKMVFWMASHSVEHATKLEVGGREWGDAIALDIGRIYLSTYPPT